LVTSYDLQPGNGASLFSKKKVSNEKVKKKRISWEEYDVNKHMIYIVLKLTNKSRV